jgi:hypothetical protein
MKGNYGDEQEEGASLGVFGNAKVRHGIGQLESVDILKPYGDKIVIPRTVFVVILIKGGVDMKRKGSDMRNWLLNIERRK